MNSEPTKKSMKMNSEPTKKSMKMNSEPTVKTAEKKTTWKDHGEKFMMTTYNGFEVIVHVETGYYNATKLCSNYGKRFNNLKRNQEFIRCINYLLNYPQKLGYLYLLKFDEYVKIGRTFDICSRYSYEERKHLERLEQVKDMYSSERLLISNFNEKFTIYKNNEYFRYNTETEYLEMLKVFDNTISSLENLPELDNEDIIPMIEFDKVSNKSKGTYIHPLLMNRVCMWLSDDYTMKVNKLMALTFEKERLEAKIEKNRQQTESIRINKLKEKYS